MIFNSLPVITTICLSIYLWGIIRTALWIAPFLFIVDGLPLAAVSILSFWAMAFSMTPFEAGAFDFRNFDKQKKALLLFGTGVLTGTYFYPDGFAHFIFGAFIPVLALFLFKIFKHEAPRIVFLPKYITKLLWISWIIFFGIRILKLRGT